MKTSIQNPLFLPALIAGLGWISACCAMAQTFTNLHNFTANSGSPYTNTDGASPRAGLILSGNTLFGTAVFGGRLTNGGSGGGTVFRVKTDGTAFTTLHTFTGGTDGSGPYGGLILSSNTLYGTTIAAGGAIVGTGAGTVFKLNTNGTGFTNLHSFSSLAGPNVPGTNTDGASPYAGLVLFNNILYGTTKFGGTNGYGTVFAVNTDGTGFTNLYTFSTALGPNSDGANPEGDLILVGNTLYGTASLGGGMNSGTVFALFTNGTGFMNVHSFTNNSDGANPFGNLVLLGNTLYGTALSGGKYVPRVTPYGTVFAVHTDGTGFTNLHTFTYGSDGAAPRAGLISAGNVLYGTALQGGASSYGTVFAITADTTNFSTLYSFSAPSLNSSSVYTNLDGYNPGARLVLSGNALYGTVNAGGTFGNGTVFKLTLGPVSAPQLTISLSGTNVILMWSAIVDGFTLQSTTNLAPAAWSTVSPPPVIVTGLNTVTNAISGTQKFYRLIQ